MSEPFIGFNTKCTHRIFLFDREHLKASILPILPEKDSERSSFRCDGSDEGGSISTSGTPLSASCISVSLGFSTSSGNAAFPCADLGFPFVSPVESPFIYRSSASPPLKSTGESIRIRVFFGLQFDVSTSPRSIQSMRVCM